MGIPVGMGSIVVLAMKSYPFVSNERKSFPTTGAIDFKISSKAGFFGGQSPSTCLSSLPLSIPNKQIDSAKQHYSGLTVKS